MMALFIVCLVLFCCYLWKNIDFNYHPYNLVNIQFSQDFATAHILPDQLFLGDNGFVLRDGQRRHLQRQH